MDRHPLPFSRDLVLIGGGHSHALLLRHWGMRPLQGVRVTIINPGPTAPYSGMLPGFVAGHYHRQDLDLDLVKLARFAGARLVFGAVGQIDPISQDLKIEGRPEISYDFASIDIGVSSTLPQLPGFQDHVTPVKPLGAFADRWTQHLIHNPGAPIVILGAGLAGVELALAMSHALRTHAPSITLVDKTAALSAVSAPSAVRLRRFLAKANVTLAEHCSLEAVSAKAVHLADGTELPAGLVVSTAGAQPQPWLAQTGLTLHNGYVAVDRYLQSSDSRIFASGDCAHMVETPRPKAGVFAVRQAAILTENLRRKLQGKTRLLRFRPQRDYLKLVSLGPKAALGEKCGIAVSGPAIWRWKDHIDRRFMDKINTLPSMPTSALPKARAEGAAEALGPKPLCGGCGAKIGPGALRRALDPKALNSPGDDAAVLTMGETRQVISTDHLRAFSEDPGVMARIAAIHALGDIWAMGAEPQAATASIILPRQSAELAERAMTEMTAMARDVFAQAGASLVGGHTTQGAELTIGFTVTGLCKKDPITLAGGQAGDVLVLTKPLGTGVVMAAEMAGAAQGGWVVQTLEHMQRPQGKEAALLQSAKAMTDVTGFGLAGHLANICEASGTGAALKLDDIPLLPGALALTEAGHFSSLYPENRSAVPNLTGRVDDMRTALLFDPQTAGGLLAALSEEEAQKAICAAPETIVVIGRLTDQANQITLL